MAALTVQTFDIDGAAITTASAGAGGDTFLNDSTEKTFLVVTNGSGGSINVTFTAQVETVTTPQYGQLDVADKVVAVANGATKYIGPFSRAIYNNASGAVAVAYSGVSSVTVAAVKMG